MSARVEEHVAFLTMRAIDELVIRLVQRGRAARRRKA